MLKFVMVFCITIANNPRLIRRDNPCGYKQRISAKSIFVYVFTSIKSFMGLSRRRRVTGHGNILSIYDATCKPGLLKTYGKYGP